MSEAFAGRLAALLMEVGAIVPVAAIGHARRLQGPCTELTYATRAEIGRVIWPDADVQACLLRRVEGAATEAFPLPEGGTVWLATPTIPSPSLVGGALSETVARAAIGVNADTIEARADRWARLEAVAARFPRRAAQLRPGALLPAVANLLRDEVPCSAVSFPVFDEDLRVTWQREAPELTAPAVPSWPPDLVECAEVQLLRGATEILRVPVRASGRALAVLELASRRNHGFTTTDVAVVQRVAEQTAAVVLEARLADARHRRHALEEQTTQLDALLGTLASTPDVRAVFDQISAICQRVLPHDAMTIIVGGDQLGKVRVYAATGAMRHLPLRVDVPLPNQPLLVSPAHHALVADLERDERYRSIPAVRAGMRSMLSMINRVGGRVHSAVNFLSAGPGRFTPDDVPIGRRIADHIGLALAQQRVADEARQVQILQNRNANLELLDALLKAVSDSRDLGEVINHLSDVAGKVLRHDAMVLIAHMDDGVQGRQYVTSGVQAGALSGSPLPDGLRRSDWDYQVIDDLRGEGTNDLGDMAQLGFASALRVAVRLEDRVVGVLTFASTQPHAFKHDDVIVGRRVAERVAFFLARERGVQATRRADEASERAARLEARVRALTDELDARSGYRRVIGDSASWRQVLTQATQVAATDTTVLLLGESGTGKEVVARLLHRGSRRRDAPFVALNCAALPEHLLEAELFGYERGAFTGAMQSKPGQLEQASGGVLFLDEVGEMTMAAQAKFLRVLQEREFQRLGGTRVLRTDARIVAATNRDLERATASGQFREDLFYRLNVFTIRLPPLRDRQDDILPLAKAFLAEFARTFAHPPAGLSREATHALRRYHWPGNVRELRNILERAAILCDGGVITDEHLALPAPRAVVPAPGQAAPLERIATTASTLPASGDLPSMERAMIEQALQHARFNKSKAAKALGLTRHQLYIRMRRHGLGD